MESFRDNIMIQLVDQNHKDDINIVNESFDLVGKFLPSYVNEKKDDWYNVELMTQHTFWNKYHLGCDEHYLVHKLRQDKDYLPELSRIAVKDGVVIGCIMYSKARVADGADAHAHEIITFGPLCVEPKWQGYGVGEMLLRATMDLAANKGYKGIVIFGEPDYYPRIGFKTCDNFHITTADGKNFDAFMGIELVEEEVSGENEINNCNCSMQSYLG